MIAAEAVEKPVGARRSQQPGNVMPDRTNGAIDVRNIVHRFGGTSVAVADVSLHVRPQEFVSIVGPSGCGKTTLLNLVAGLISVEAGSIAISGTPPREGRNDIAYMLARDSLLPWLTALDNATFGAKVRGASRQEREEKARDLLAQVGLRGFENAFPKALSHGMRQRVALARTFCLDSSVLLMDEPFGALDTQTKLQLEDVLLKLWTSQRKTVVFITHDLAEAIALSDRVIVMRARPGTIIADIEIDLPRPRHVMALQKNAHYHELYAEIWSKLETAFGET